MNIFEAQLIYERLERLSHRLGRIWLNNENRAHFVVS